ncbi:unnamed protein product, partial [Closterium sp. NIES-53]
LCFAFLDWSCDPLFSPTLPMGAEAVATLHRQVEERTQEAAQMHLMAAACNPPTVATTGSPVPSSVNNQHPASVGMLHATTQHSSLLATTNALWLVMAPVVQDGAPIPNVLLDL